MTLFSASHLLLLNENKLNDYEKYGNENIDNKNNVTCNYNNNNNNNNNNSNNNNNIIIIIINANDKYDNINNNEDNVNSNDNENNDYDYKNDSYYFLLYTILKYI